MSELLFIGIRKKTKNGWTIVAISAIVIVVAGLNGLEKEFYLLHEEILAWGLLHDVISMLLRNLFCVGFVGAGYYIGRGILPGLNKKRWVFGAMLLSGILAGLVIPMNRGVDLRYMNLGKLPLFFVGAVAGTMTVLFFSRLLETVSVKVLRLPFEYYGRNSLIVMVTHMDFRVLYCSIRLAAVIQPFLGSQAVFCMIVIILVFVLEIPIIWFLNRYLPIILGKKSEIS